MAILDDVLAGLVAGLKNDLAGAGLTRQRGGQFIIRIDKANRQLVVRLMEGLLPDAR